MAGKRRSAKLAVEKIEKAVNSVSLTAIQEKRHLVGAPESPCSLNGFEHAISFPNLSQCIS